MTGFKVTTRSLPGATTAIGSADRFTLVVDRPSEAGGGGLGFNGGQLLNLAVAGCISNDLFREAAKLGIELYSVKVMVDSDYAGDPPVSTPIGYEVAIEGDADRATLERLVRHTDSIAEIPNSLRNGTEVRLGSIEVREQS